MNLKAICNFDVNRGKKL